MPRYSLSGPYFSTGKPTWRLRSPSDKEYAGNYVYVTRRYDTVREARQAVRRANAFLRETGALCLSDITPALIDERGLKKTLSFLDYSSIEEAQAANGVFAKMRGQRKREIFVLTYQGHSIHPPPWRDAIGAGLKKWSVIDRNDVAVFYGETRQAVTLECLRRNGQHHTASVDEFAPLYSEDRIEGLCRG
jgi:hypothetical protein